MAGAGRRGSLLSRRGWCQVYDPAEVLEIVRGRMTVGSRDGVSVLHERRTIGDIPDPEAVRSNGRGDVEWRRRGLEGRMG